MTIITLVFFIKENVDIDISVKKIIGTFILFLRLY